MHQRQDPVTIVTVEIDHQAFMPAKSMVTLIDNGPSAYRIDFVCVGDGYLESELASYAREQTL